MTNIGLGLATQVVVMAIVISVMILFVGIGALALIHVCIVGRAFRRGSGNGTGNAVETGSFGSRSMSQDDIENLPCFDFKAGEKGSSPVDCAVCLENFKVGDKCRLLPLCKHSFHAQCVDLWLLKTPICPICRSRTGSGHYSEIGSESRGSQTGNSCRVSEIGGELRESQTGDSDHLNEVGIEQLGPQMNRAAREITV